jgi:hypothetical protein
MPAKPAYAFDVEGHTVVTTEKAPKKKHPFKLSENPSIDEKYFYWYFTEGHLWELPVKLVLLVPTLFLILVVGVVTAGDK